MGSQQRFSSFVTIYVLDLTTRTGATMTKSDAITLQDGRRLGYVEFGVPTGHPIFYFTGGTASGLFGQVLHSAAAQAGARIIAPDRPGIGLSNFQPGRVIGDWPDDVCQLADSLGIGRFSVMSESGGSPYAAVCALKLPERLTAAAIVAGTSPFDAPGVLDGMSAQNRLSALMILRIPSWLLNAMYWPTALMARHNPDGLRSQLAQSANGMCEVDRVVFKTPEYQDAILEAFCAAFRQGARGPILDLKLCAGSWGSWLPDIPMEIQLWYGEADQNTPAAMAHYLEQEIPRCRMTLFPNEGHVSVMANHGQEILQNLMPDGAQLMKN
jgi:pimeloyl-ACP methyl ester carboxylesterase